MRMKSTLPRIAEVAPILGVGLAIVAMAIQLGDQLKLGEFLISGTTLIATAAAGAASLYIARKAKSISTHKRIFISYSGEQRDQARALREALVKRGAYVWLDENNLQPGDNLAAAINSAIESSNTVVAFLSPEIGPHLRMELTSAKANNVPIIAVMSPNSRPFGEFTSDGTLRVVPSGTDIAVVADQALRAPVSSRGAT